MDNGKKALLDAGNYEIYNRDLFRKVFPRIISEFKAVNPRAQVNDIIPFYFALLSHIDGKKHLSDGITPNISYGSAFLSQSEINRLTGINRKRHSWLAEILRQNGVLLDVKERYVGGKNYIYYYPSFCPHVTEDGFVVNTDTGEIYTQDVDALLARLSEINKR